MAHGRSPRMLPTPTSIPLPRAASSLVQMQQRNPLLVWTPSGVSSGQPGLCGVQVAEPSRSGGPLSPNSSRGPEAWGRAGCQVSVNGVATLFNLLGDPAAAPDLPWLGWSLWAPSLAVGGQFFYPQTGQLLFRPLEIPLGGVHTLRLIRWGWGGEQRGGGRGEEGMSPVNERSAHSETRASGDL